MAATSISRDIRSASRSRAWSLAPFALALFFGLWALRGATTNLVDTDAARHAMNGVFLHDMVAEGKVASPVAFARSYYSRYPALSIPYHPPLFPAFESLFFLAFGVNILTARLAVAAATAIAVLLFYRLVLATHRSHPISLASSAIFFSLPSIQFVAAEVMLEMPTLVFALAAVWYLRDVDRDFPLGRGIGFALFAGAAVWTKQNALYLGIVPFLYAAIERRWRLLAGKTIWIASILFGGAFAGLMAFSMMAKASGNARWPKSGPLAVISHNIPYYLSAMKDEVGLWAALFAGAVVIWLLVGRLMRRGQAADSLYLAWTLAVFLLVFLLPPFDARYLFFAYPALAVLATVALFRIGAQLLPARRAWWIPAGVAAALCIGRLSTQPVSYLRGPSEAAARIAAESPGRVMYFGRASGHFIFFLRCVDPQRRSVVIRGDKLPASTFTAAEMDQFAHRYGVRHIVVERRPIRRPWDVVFDAPPASMELVGQLPLESTEARLNGRLLVFRFNNPSPNPESTLKLRTLAGGVDAEL